MKQKKCKIRENRREKVRKTREEKNGELRYVKESFENEKIILQRKFLFKIPRFFLRFINKFNNKAFSRIPVKILDLEKSVNGYVNNLHMGPISSF